MDGYRRFALGTYDRVPEKYAQWSHDMVVRKNTWSLTGREILAALEQL